MKTAVNKMVYGRRDDTATWCAKCTVRFQSNNHAQCSIMMKEMEGCIILELKGDGEGAFRDERDTNG